MSKIMSKKLRDTIPMQRVEGTFGVEIELEGVGLPAAAFGWEVHKEGSLRGEAKEYVTIGACTTADLSNRLDFLTNAFEENASRVSKDCYRASTHIHVNVQEKTYWEIFSSIIAFTLIEPVFMRLCGPTRDGNLFCLPSYDCGDLPEFFGRATHHLAINGTLYGVGQHGKYAALNTNNLTKIGTLEFRTFRCSIDKDEILKWAGWCERVVEYGSQYRDMSHLIKDFSENPEVLLDHVFRREHHKFDLLDLGAMAEIGIESAFEAHRMFEFTARETSKKVA